jgi:predicted DNA-binding WGR domain protein
MPGEREPTYLLEHAAAAHYDPVVRRSLEPGGVMRSFTCTAGQSSKFWNIDLQGQSFTVSWGRTATKGQSQTKEFKDEASARKEHDKLVQQKLVRVDDQHEPSGNPEMDTEPEGYLCEGEFE